MLAPRKTEIQQREGEVMKQPNREAETGTRATAKLALEAAHAVEAVTRKAVATERLASRMHDRLKRRALRDVDRQVRARFGDFKAARERALQRLLEQFVGIDWLQFAVDRLGGPDKVAERFIDAKLNKWQRGRLRNQLRASDESRLPVGLLANIFRAAGLNLVWTALLRPDNPAANTPTTSAIGRKRATTARRAPKRINDRVRGKRAASDR